MPKEQKKTLYENEPNKKYVVTLQRANERRKSEIIFISFQLRDAYMHFFGVCMFSKKKFNIIFCVWLIKDNRKSFDAGLHGSLR